jgi:hypothetical protein
MVWKRYYCCFFAGFCQGDSVKLFRFLDSVLERNKIRYCRREVLGLRRQYLAGINAGLEHQIGFFLFPSDSLAMICMPSSSCRMENGPGVWHNKKLFRSSSELFQKTGNLLINLFFVME